MKKVVLGFLSLALVAGIFAFAAPKNPVLTTHYFRFLDDDINFTTLKTASSWDEVGSPSSDCSEGDLPCLVQIDDLQDYGGVYSPGVIDEVDFARFLELQGSSNAQAYVTGDNMLASKE